MTEATLSEERMDAAPLTGWQRFLIAFSSNRLALVAAAYLIALLVTALLGLLIAPHDPIEVDLARAFEGPSLDHWLGTDHLGRSTSSRTIAATQVALEAASLGVGIAIVLGAPLGLLFGYFGGWWDRIAMRIVEAVIALPALLVAIAIIAILGPSLTNAMIALGIANSTAFFRLMRGSALEVREALYVDAARVAGASPLSIVFGHVLPNVTGPLTVQTTLAFSYVLLAEAGLSFIGLGVQPPESSWGAMLATAQRYVYQHPFMALPPGLMIMFTVLAFNLLGDGLRDAWARVDANRSRPNRAMRPRFARAQEKTVGPESASLLEVRDLEIRFPAPRRGEVAVTSNVTFDVERGRTLGLVGESGCGKSVTAMAITGLLSESGYVARGSIRFEGRELVNMDTYELNAIRGADIGMIFQEPGTSLNPAFTVGNQLREVLRTHTDATEKQAHNQALELLDRVGIPDARRRARDYPHQFSGGMAQRVMIAMAIACRPKLLIADEPTTALDVTIQGQVLDLLTDLQDEHGMAILLITHDLGVVADMCDDAVVMYAGQVVEQADVDTLLALPKHPYTAGLLASMPENQIRGQRLTQIPGRVPPAWDWPAGCRFHPRCPHAAEACRTAAADISSMARGGERFNACVRTTEIDVSRSW